MNHMIKTHINLQLFLCHNTNESFASFKCVSAILHSCSVTSTSPKNTSTVLFVVFCFGGFFFFHCVLFNLTVPHSRCKLVQCLCFDWWWVPINLYYLCVCDGNLLTANVRWVPSSGTHSTVKSNIKHTEYIGLFHHSM